MSQASVRKALLQRRSAVLGEIEGRDEFVAQNAVEDEEDKSFERLEDEVLSALSASDRDEVKRIEIALEKIAEGSWGICETCGGEIGAKRLEAMPEALLCIDCASAAEQ